jgi:ketopantoate reductase
MARRIRKSTAIRKSGKVKSLGKAALTVAVTALLEAAVQKVLKDPKFRRKAVALVEEAGRRSKSAGKQLSRAISRSRNRGSKRS